MKQTEKVVYISKDIFQSLIEQCQQALPYESCGFLSGNVKGIVTSNWQLKNEAKSMNQFFVSRDTVREALNKIAEKKEEILVLYHSHPTTAPMPSRQDLQYHPDDQILMLIISFKNDNLRYKCFEIFDANYSEVPVQLI